MKTKMLLIVLFLLSVSINAQELALANQDGKYGYITKTGDWHIKPNFTNAKSF